MNKKVKSLLLVLCAIVFFASGIFATLAWFNSQDKVQNTFSIGNVEITLDETDVDEYGAPIPDASARVDQNEYLVIPGHTYTKDPIIHVSKESQPAYLFVRIDNPLEFFEDETTIHNQMIAKGWALADNNTHKGLYVKMNDGAYEVIDARLAAKDVEVFDTIKIHSKWDYNSFSEFHDAPAEVNVTAFAIQQDQVDEDEALRQAIATLYPTPADPGEGE